ncbi:hypothetical protein TNCV_796781 [Trichonephila clavipes]|uniref:Uncharacterized protein n=1 Tax=Trichonephila clavipes TaxID=2585209 RepID=A0A8X7BL80_TRICX|nr:hypothetical protein TNCV_796781 [Trichonephila clavipes]
MAASSSSVIPTSLAHADTLEGHPRMGEKGKPCCEDGSNQEDPHKKWGGRTYPKARNALSKQSSGGARGRTQEGKRDGRRQ